MPKKTLLRIMPKPDALKNHKHFKIFGDLLHNPNLWHLNRRSAAGAFAVGLFVTFIPLPSQMIIAAAFAMLFRVNLPLSVALVWISNPITLPAIFFLCYFVGAKLLSQPIIHYHLDFSLDGTLELLETLGPAFLLGSLVMAIICSSLGYLVINNLWRYNTMRRYKKRHYFD
ncbi:DUF2062 domain-containing protein [Alginatibacterium sediminis]|uniref:DUF2062 domain-containing protein n=1 Tax=Alginatibacterium sediminis TaxID=2164068 RepID=A0A420EAW0_9ALTE|nr:DUF2062 domain-containing protein [Alginatibacterium sediminis]RKF17793.1 DUF2062 domain-containing protein [Alginatibacterium sediminis]